MASRIEGIIVYDRGGTRSRLLRAQPTNNLPVATVLTTTLGKPGDAYRGHGTHRVRYDLRSRRAAIR